MKVIIILVLMVIVVRKSPVFAQSGDGNVGSISVKLQIRLPDEIFMEQYNDKMSGDYLSLKMKLEEDLEKEIKAELKKLNHKFSSFQVTVNNMRNGSIIAEFTITVAGTSISGSDLFKVARTASLDSKIGNFTTKQIEDFDECKNQTNNCTEFSQCKNTIESFQCVCNPGYFDEVGSGNRCVTPVTVSCETDKMIISMKPKYLANILGTSSQLRLDDGNCLGNSSNTSSEYQFLVNVGFRKCGTIKTTNASHFTYSNALHIEPKTEGNVLTGSKIVFPLSCSFLKNLTASLDFEGSVSHTNNSVQGNGSFTVDLKLYKTSLFLEEETKQVFETSDNLFVEARLNAQDSDLTVVLNRCWATPSANIIDREYHDIITKGCAVPSAVAGSVNVIANGESMRSKFSVQVFVFLSSNTVYLHCGLTVCSTDKETCEPSCSSSGIRKRRNVREYSVLTVGRVKRDIKTRESEQEKTVGPFYRKASTFDFRFWTTLLSLVAVVILLLLIVTYFILKYRNRSKNTVGLISMKMRNLEMDNLAYT